MGLLIVGFLAMAALASAQDAPAGWKIVKDKQNICQFAVPPDWTPDKLVASFMMSADRKASAVAHGQRAGMSLEQAAGLAKQTMNPIKTFEESATRVWFAVARNNGKPGQSWYIAVAGPQVCSAQVDFDNDAMEADAKKIALSLRPVK